jgi:hypothetical protein
VLLGVILDKLGSIPASESANILGGQLQVVPTHMLLLFLLICVVNQKQMEEIKTKTRINCALTCMQSTGATQGQLREPGQTLNPTSLYHILCNAGNRVQVGCLHHSS